MSNEMTDDAIDLLTVREAQKHSIIRAFVPYNELRAYTRAVVKAALEAHHYSPTEPQQCIAELVGALQKVTDLAAGFSVSGVYFMEGKENEAAVYDAYLAIEKATGKQQIHVA